ncbi:MAG: hypothetical protein AVDCRST_MAG47-494, partial [uncultured Nocardioidaceae bacterium]
WCRPATSSTTRSQVSASPSCGRAQRAAARWPR